MSFATATGVHASLQSAAIAGAGARPVEVQVDLALGLPGFHLVGLPDHACNDARTRVLTAVRNSGYQLPQKKITVNLAPGDLRKQGVAFDLPIAVGILVAAGLVPLPERPPLVVGELALSGEVLPVRGVLPIGLEARRLGFQELIVPEPNAPEGALVQGLRVRGARTLAEAAETFSGANLRAPASPAAQPIHWWAAVSANRSQSCSIKPSRACVFLALMAFQPRAEPPNRTMRVTRPGWLAA